MNKDINTNDFKAFVIDIKQKILSTQYEALKKVNKELISLYWDIGKSIVLKQEEFGWGKSVVKNLSEELRAEFVGMKGFSVQNLWNMRQFYIEYKDNTKLQTLSREIGWSHNTLIAQKCKDNLHREFYIKMVKKFGWSYRVLDNQIDNKTFEKTMINQINFDKTLEDKYKHQAILAVKDEYNFDFLDLGSQYSEHELEIGKFKPEYAGKMNFYLSALNDTIKLPDENPSIGIIICKEKKRTTVEYALRDSKQAIGVSTYKLTETLPTKYDGLLPTHDELEEKLLQFFDTNVTMEKFEGNKK